MWEAREAAQRKDFYPRPPRGGRPQSRPACDNISLYFYPRPPRGGRHQYLAKNCCIKRFLSTPSARRATTFHQMLRPMLTNFYPRPPRGGRRPSGLFYRGKFLFLSTPSARRATNPSAPRAPEGRDFYPRPPRGGRPRWPTSRPRRRKISIHALREEGDQSRPACDNISLYFYPRPPRGGRRGYAPSGRYCS